MKTLTLLFLLLINYAFGQYPRRANLAVIETDVVLEFPLFRECMNILKMEGYEFSLNDPLSLKFITEPVQIHELPLLFKLVMEVDGPYVILQGFILDDRDFEKMGLSPIPKKWEFASYRSFPHSTWRTGFIEVVRLSEIIRSGLEGKTTWMVAENSMLDERGEEKLWGDNSGYQQE